jgi:hypothetical protein
MKIDADRWADRGCWISDDRVYAFLSTASGGIEEIGFHGPQPVSRNSRVFADSGGFLRFAHDGRELRIGSLDWYAGGANADRDETESGLLTVEASGNRIVVTSRRGDAFGVRMTKKGLFCDVHGTRHWETLSAEGEWLLLRFRDLILLDPWMKREGPYAGDFLIPEPVRRRIFRRRCRSGEGTAEDLLPEYRESRFALYDAAVRCRIGGPGFHLKDDGDAWVFLSNEDRSEERHFLISFHDERERETPPSTSRPPPPVRDRYERVLRSSPGIRVPGHPHVEQFFATLPALVESCVIRDHGLPRATPGSYYWIWAWDAMVTALGALRWGNQPMGERTARFVNLHRDSGGEIPMRWTRDLLPLDTQERGALETLLLSLTAECTSGPGGTLLAEVYPHAVTHLRILGAEVDRQGFCANIGFYPDLPLRFGRSSRSATAIENLAFYTFCRRCETVALRLEDLETAERASALAARLERSLPETFWDPDRGFFRDAVDAETGLPNPSYPLFSLLFLHAPEGMTLLRGRLPECAEFISKHLLTPAGFRTLPGWDIHAHSETVSGSWYPHWDLYALKILRRAGRTREIMTWLSSVERALAHLGFAPETLPIDRLLAGDPEAWHDHGSTSNLNCAAGWYGALLEGIMGLEMDLGGMTIIPCRLPIGSAGVRGIVCLGTTWDVEVENGGEECEALEVDGLPLEGTLKIPSPYSDGGRHRLLIRYGPTRGVPRLRELINGEVLSVTPIAGGGVVLETRVFGRGELVAEQTTGTEIDGSLPSGAPPGSALFSCILPAGRHRVVIR